MTSARQKIITGFFAVAGATGLAAYLSNTPKQLDQDFTGTANLLCEGELYKLVDRKKADKTVDQVAPVNLKLTFQNGRITSWAASSTIPKPAESGLAESDLMGKFEVVCAKNQSKCTPTVTQNGDTELYFFNYEDNGVQFGGVGRLSKDLRNFAGYTKMNSDEFANPMSCKIL